MVAVVGVETVGKTVCELQFGAQLKEGKVEVASQSRFQKDIIFLHLQIVVVLVR